MIKQINNINQIPVCLDIIHKSGAWFSYNGDKIGQGRENTKEWLKNNPEVMKEIEEQIKAKSDELDMLSKRSKKTSAAESAAAEAASAAAASAAAGSEAPAAASAKKSAVDVTIDAEDDFEEFTPVVK